MSALKMILDKGRRRWPRAEQADALDGAATIAAKAFFRRPDFWLKAACLGALLAAATALYWELGGSHLQSLYASRWAKRLTYQLDAGPSDAIRFPTYGPFDERSGYTDIPRFLQLVLPKGYRISQQAKLSPMHQAWIDAGFFAVYPEKSQAGLTILDATARPLFSARHPQQVYQEFSSIPDLVVKTLLFIENRELLDERYPFKNPVVEWDRLARASLDMFIARLVPDHAVPGGSTLATQIEKYRHSPGGRTAGLQDKAVQMVSATVRAYANGRETRGFRERVVADYINSVPLGAIAGVGEIRGLAQGLKSWFGADFSETNAALSKSGDDKADAESLSTKAKAYKQILSLFVAQRRPAFYLQQDREALKALTEKYLASLSEAGVIGPALHAATAKYDLRFQPTSVSAPATLGSFIERKGANAVRVHLMQLLGLDRLYSLDHLDLTVTSTIDLETQAEVTKVLQQLRDPDFAAAAGLNQHRLLAQGDPRDVVYSFTLRERHGGANVLRVQADNVDGPFNVSEGGKLELGSTAKLRTLVSYLQVIEDLWRQYAMMPARERARVEVHPADRLTQWALKHFAQADDKSLAATLEAAMNRSYSASPQEAFFTGGGVHRFGNFQSDDDQRIVDVREALRHSINLPFVRMMREIVIHYVGRIPNSRALLADPKSPLRQQYLMRFANIEGRDYLRRFYLKYRHKNAQEIMALLLERARGSLRRLAAIHAELEPNGDYESFQAFIGKYAAKPANPSERRVKAAFDDVRRAEFSLQDRGYIIGIHPLELWLAAFTFQNPRADFSSVLEASVTARQEAYRWLFLSKSKDKQDLRIRIMLEQEAFQAIHSRWRSVGYPFGSLVSTYATALGSSGDRPSSLAELVGIILADGVRYPLTRVTDMRFAEGTPFETHLTTAPPEGERVLSPEIAAIVKAALRSVVEEGTAQRVSGSFTLANGEAIAVGGKTGTGDNRYAIYAPGGRVIESKVISRTATFVFFIGDRFFGTLTAYVPTAKASHYNFTSALPVQILKVLAPKLAPLINRSTAVSTTAAGSSYEKRLPQDGVAL